MTTDDEDDNDKEESQSDDDEQSSEPEGPLTLGEELEIEDLSRCIYFKDSKIFAAAGPGLPLLQVNTDGTFVSLDPDLPYRDSIDVEVVVSQDKYGRLLNELGEVRKVVGMTYNGKQLYFVAERHPDNEQHLAAWFDDEWKPHYLYLGDTLLSAPMLVNRLRNHMLSGELSELQTGSDQTIRSD
ncbi:MAG: hypothetical protein K2X27_11290 [Candidatus Obscuribacterales bacterium]|nr:hypothetical protein [Candidatus Obscuribacterales bacterium]